MVHDWNPGAWDKGVAGYTRQVQIERNGTWQRNMEGTVYQEEHLHVYYPRGSETLGAWR